MLYTIPPCKRRYKKEIILNLNFLNVLNVYGISFVFCYCLLYLYIFDWIITMTQIITMTITRYIKFFYAWNKPKSKKKMRIKENKEKKCIKLKNKYYEDLG